MGTRRTCRAHRLGKLVPHQSLGTILYLLGKLATGESIDEILAAHPRLTREAVQAALAFAAESLKADVTYPVPDEAA